MTREEKQKVINALRISAPVMAVTQEEFNDYIHTLNKIMDWLEQEPSGDAISRQAVLEYIKGSEAELGHSSENELVCQDIKELPPVISQQRMGYWIRWYEQKENNGYTENIPHCKCSECNTEYDPHTSQFIKYCNECGAKMVTPQESETWNGIHAQITAPKGTFERIFNEADDDNDI